MLVDRSDYVAEEEEGEGWRWTADDFFDLEEEAIFIPRSRSRNLLGRTIKITIRKYYR